MKLVFDSNVLLSAMFSRGLCEALFNECFLSRTRTLVLSPHILDEFAQRAVSKFHVPLERAAATAAFLRTAANMAEPGDVAPDACRDSKDLPVLGTAQAADADYLVTGDQDLLVLKRFGKTEIVTPRQMYEKLLAE